jgi:urease accessory protein UreF
VQGAPLQQQQQQLQQLQQQQQQQQQQPHPAVSWGVCSTSAGGSSSPAPDDWEIDIAQLHIDSKVRA